MKRGERGTVRRRRRRKGNNWLSNGREQSMFKMKMSRISGGRRRWRREGEKEVVEA